MGLRQASTEAYTPPWSWGAAVVEIIRYLGYKIGDKKQPLAGRLLCTSLAQSYSSPLETAAH